MVGIPGDRLPHVVVSDQVGAGTARLVVPVREDVELAGCVEGVCVPAGGQHASVENQVNVAALPDAQTDPNADL